MFELSSTKSNYCKCDISEYWAKYDVVACRYPPIQSVYLIYCSKCFCLFVVFICGRFGFISVLYSEQYYLSPFSYEYLLIYKAFLNHVNNGYLPHRYQPILSISYG